MIKGGDARQIKRQTKKLSASGDGYGLLRFGHLDGTNENIAAVLGIAFVFACIMIQNLLDLILTVYLVSIYIATRFASNDK